MEEEEILEDYQARVQERQVLIKVAVVVQSSKFMQAKQQM
jgi:hypothetical protein